MKKTDGVLLFAFSISIIVVAILLVITIHKRSVLGQSTQSTVMLPIAGPLYGVNVDMSQLLPTSTHYVRNAKGQDLIDIAHDLGVTVFRITSVTPSSSTYVPYTEEQWNTVLDKMAKDNIRAMILVESPVEQSNFTSGVIDSQQYLQLLQNLIISSNVGNNADVMAIDLKNEPVLTSQNLALLMQARAIVKKAYPNMPVTVGGWRYQLAPNKFRWNEPMDAAPLQDIVDFYSVHIYSLDQIQNGIFVNPTQVAQGYLARVKQYLSTDKAVFISEFGAGNGDAFTDQQTLGSHELQASAYAGIYTAIQNEKDLKILGSTAFDFIARNSNPDSWSILENNGNTILPAAYILKSYAIYGKSSMQFSSFPQNVIVNNANNNQTITIRKADILGVELKQDPQANLKIALSNQSILSTTESLYYDGWGTQAYYTVLHAQQAGQTSLAIGSFHLKIIVN